MEDIQKIIKSLRSEINLYRDERGNRYVAADVLAVEIAVNLVEFGLKRERAILPNEEIWFEATYQIAYGFDGTEREQIYTLYKELIKYVKLNDHLRKNIPKLEWEN